MKKWLLVDKLFPCTLNWVLLELEALWPIGSTEVVNWRNRHKMRSWLVCAKTQHARQMFTMELTGGIGQTKPLRSHSTQEVYSISITIATNVLPQKRPSSVIINNKWEAWAEISLKMRHFVWDQAQITSLWCTQIWLDKSKLQSITICWIDPTSSQSLQDHSQMHPHQSLPQQSNSLMNSAKYKRREEKHPKLSSTKYGFPDYTQKCSNIQLAQIV